MNLAFAASDVARRFIATALRLALSGALGRESVWAKIDGGYSPGRIRARPNSWKK